ncbi:uncharacterized protein N0V89_007682 [Didymosphaeria variabile]|uniref:Chitin-binding type-4 domain-containing protein n=1 Tax=Didymosphaeria variabile TaxID=1932322 RepID=A0A9W8XJU9_9PLEO|nr:uncharacterized protein N0V89_007682 [Didymosphaeria variabile]KAJ4352334.1 hypothetical protein N0V89_007682 [Didymosphaeria variabile]
MRASTFFTSTFFAATALAHGNIVSPPVRLPGPVTQQVCGADTVSALTADETGPLENIPSNGAPDCNVFLCKGVQFEDNQNNVQAFAPGEQVDFAAELPIPHEGPCNVSVVDLATNTLVGQPLISFASYADENLAQLPLNNTQFSVTMPTDLGTQCQQPGECAMQWFWFGTNAQQTYENCVDFVMTA